MYLVNVEAKHWHRRVVNKYDSITNEKQRGPAFVIPELEPARQVPQALLAHCCTVIFCNRLYEPGQDRTSDRITRPDFVPAR